MRAQTQPGLLITSHPSIKVCHIQQCKSTPTHVHYKVKKKTRQLRDKVGNLKVYVFFAVNRCNVKIL